MLTARMKNEDLITNREPVPKFDGVRKLAEKYAQYLLDHERDEPVEDRDDDRRRLAAPPSSSRKLHAIDHSEIHEEYHGTGLFRHVPTSTIPEIAALRGNLEAVEHLNSGMETVQDIFIDVVAGVLNSSTEDVRQFIELVDPIGGSIPLKNLMCSDTRQFVNMVFTLDLIAAMTHSTHLMFTEKLEQIQNVMTDSASEYNFMPPTDAASSNDNILDAIRADLMEHVFSDETPFSYLKDSAEMYMSDLYSLVEDMILTHYIVMDTSNGLTDLFDGKAKFSDIAVSRLISQRLRASTRMSDIFRGNTASISSMASEVISLASSAKSDVMKLESALSGVPLATILEGVLAAKDASNGNENMQMSVLKFVEPLSAAHIKNILTVRDAALLRLELDSAEELYPFWSELQLMLMMYSEYIGRLHLEPEVFTLREFAMNTSHLMHHSDEVRAAHSRHHSHSHHDEVEFTP